MSATDLREQYEQMIRHYWGNPATEVEVIDVMAFWPSKQPGDIGWAYVAISGEGFSEAVTVVVSRVNGSLLIRDIEWGRP